MSFIFLLLLLNLSLELFKDIILSLVFFILCILYFDELRTMIFLFIFIFCHFDCLLLKIQPWQIYLILYVNLSKKIKIYE